MATLSAGAIPMSFAYASRYSAGRVSLPVAPSAVLYANFEHVSGQAAGEGAPTLSIDRLKILDVLIDRLQSVKSEPLAAAEAPAELTSGRVDALIKQYGAELHALAAAPAVPYAPKPPVEAGMLFSFAA